MLEELGESAVSGSDSPIEMETRLFSFIFTPSLKTECRSEFKVFVTLASDLLDESVSRADSPIDRIFPSVFKHTAPKGRMGNIQNVKRRIVDNDFQSFGKTPGELLSGQSLKSIRIWRGQDMNVKAWLNQKSFSINVDNVKCQKSTQFGVDSEYI